MRTVTIGADPATLYAIRIEPRPAGLTIAPGPNPHLKAFDFHVDLKLNIDLTVVTTEIVALWIMARVGPDLRRGLEVYLNRKRLPPQETEAAKMIVDAIHDDEDQENPKQ